MYKTRGVVALLKLRHFYVNFKKAGRVTWVLLQLSVFLSSQLLVLVHPAYAASSTWDFSTAGDYTYDSNQIEISSGLASLKATSNWYNSSWTRRKSISIDNTGNSSAITNYQIQLTVAYDADMQADFDDIRFTDSNGTTLIDHWLESKTDSLTATYWVEVPSISALSSKTIYVYYGNSSATSTSDSAATFIDFDDFNRVNLSNTVTWSKSASNPLTDYNHGDPAVFYENGTFYIFANNQSGGDIDLYTSTDGTTLTLYGTVLSNEGSGFESNNVRDTYVLKVGSTYHMWYTGSTAASGTSYKIGHATSTNLTTWVKDPANPVFSHVAEGVSEPTVLYEPTDTGREFKMLYTAGSGDTNDIGFGDIGYAYSSDGVSWTDTGDVLAGMSLQDQEQIKVGDKYIMYVNSSAANNILVSYSLDHENWTTPTAYGGLTKGAAYDSVAVWAPTIVKVGSTYYMYYQGHSGSGQTLALATNTGEVETDWEPSNSNAYFTISSNQLLKQDSVSIGTGWQYLTRNYFKSPPYIYETDFSFITAGDSGYRFGFYFADDASNHYAVIMRPSDNTISLWQTSIPEGGTNNILSSTTSYTLTANTSYKFRARVSETDIKIDFYNGSWNNNILSTTATTTNSRTGYFGFSTTNNFSADNYRVRTLTSVEPSASFGSEATLYSTSSPSVNPSSSNALTFTSISGFTETATKNGGEIKYQISNDTGTTWYWYNSGWTVTTSGYAESNIASDINSNIATFPVGSGSFLFKAYLNSNGSQLVQLNEVSVTYENIVPTPTATPTTTQNTSVSTSIVPAPSCGDQSPGAKAPALYGAIPQSSESILLYFTPADQPVSKYTLEYGTQPGNYQYGVQDLGLNESNQMTYQVSALTPNTTYYFRVRAGNGCAVGEWSNEISAKTWGHISTNNLSFSEFNLAPVADKIPVDSCQPYTVSPGDSLWSISENVLGDGDMYQEIIDQNIETHPSLSSSSHLDVGWKLKINCSEEEQLPNPQIDTSNTESTKGYKVSIKVLDTNQKPVEGAKVTIHSKVQEATTDANGFAHFTDVEPGDHRVLIAYNNFEGEQSVNLTGDVKEFSLSITVQEKSLSLSPLAYGIITFLLVLIAILVIYFNKRLKASGN